MEPIGVIVGAMTAAVANLAEPAVRDSYEGVKSLIQRKFGENPMLGGALEGIEHDPETWARPLESALTGANADSDPDIQVAIAALREQLNALAQRTGGDVLGAHGTQISHTGSGDIIMGDSAGGEIDKSTTHIETGGGNYVAGNMNANTHDE